MSKKQDKDGYFVFTCDACGEEAGGEEQDFSEAWGALRAEGWRYASSAHYCGDCARDYT